MQHNRAEIFLLRHGETQWNVTGRFQGTLDSPLTERGIGQSVAMGRLLAERVSKADAQFASPLGRVRQTNQVIRSFGNYPETIWDSRLEEVSIGSWNGLTHIDIDACWPGALDGSSPYDWFFRSPDGESYDSAAARVNNWLSGLNGVIVALSHGLLGRIIRGRYLGLDRNEALSLPIPQDAIWRLADGRAELLADG